ncbi:MAG: transposase [Halanaerobiales bacterium]
MKKKYSRILKEQVVEECLISGNIPSIANKYNIPKSTVYYWVRKFRQGSLGLTSRIKDSSEVLGIINKLKFENIRLKKLIVNKELEIDLLRELLN